MRRRHHLGLFSPIILMVLAMVGGLARADSMVRLNTIGYPPSAIKQASIGQPCTNFVVLRAGGGPAVFNGKVSGPVENPDTGEMLYTADFSALKEPGTYRLEVPGVGRSPSFEIGTNLFWEPLKVVSQAMKLWRCGVAVSSRFEGLEFTHAACHTNDAWMDFVGEGHVLRRANGGWHDAGDYNKYVVNGAFSVEFLMRAWEEFEPGMRRVLGPRSSLDMNRYLEEVNWELYWLLTMQADDGSVYHKVSTQKFGGMISPEAETEPRFLAPWSSAATAYFAAVMAHASRFMIEEARTSMEVGREYSRQPLAAAEKSYAFVLGRPENHPADLKDFTTGPYQTDDSDGRLWAAAELWETTGETRYLGDFERRVRARQIRFDQDWDWGKVKNLGLLTYLFSKRTGRDEALVTELRTNLVAVANQIVRTGAAHGYRRPLGGSYYWGCNGSVARQVMILRGANRLAPDPKYRETALDAMNHLFGRNVRGRSYVTGLGFEPPLHPHDRRSAAVPGSPAWPGYLVGGPHPKPMDWKDEEKDYRSNEIAINWNAALIYALASLLETK